MDENTLNLIVSAIASMADAHQKQLHIISYAAVSIIGAIVGATELMSRYPDSPFRAVRNLSGFFYTLLNAVGAVLALYFIQRFNWDFGLGKMMTIVQIELTQTMAAAFGAMSILRSSLFNVRVGDHDLAVGPAAVLQVLLSATDRQVDRMRAEQRSEAIKKAMAGIDSYAQIKIALPTHCMALMQNVSADEEKQIRQVADNIEQLEIADCLKVLNLGLVLMNIVGDGVLKTAVANVVQSHKSTQKQEQLAEQRMRQLMAQEEQHQQALRESADSDSGEQEKADKKTSQ
jgi:hypothetical protein